MTGSEQPSIVCCLSAGDHRRRLAWIGSLARKALRSHDRDDLVLYLAYAPEAAAEGKRWSNRNECAARS
jgi:hypothetical protein